MNKLHGTYRICDESGNRGIRWSAFDFISLNPPSNKNHGFSFKVFYGFGNPRHADQAKIEFFQ